MESQLKKITIDTLIRYIKDNISVISNVDIIDKPQNIEILSNEKKSLNKKSKTFIEEFTDSEMNSSLKFPKLKNLFSNDLLNDFLIYKVDDDCSFYRSLFIILDQNFSTSDKDKQDLIIKNFIQYLKSDIMMLGFAQYEYSKLKFNKKNMYNDLDKNIISKEIMRYCADVFHINIFYIDYKDETINYTGGNFIPFKKSIILLKINDRFNICYNVHGKIFRFNNNDFFDTILTNSDIIKLLTSDKFNICTEDLNKYIKKDKKKSTINANVNQNLNFDLDFDKIIKKSQIQNTDSTEINKMNGYESDENEIEIQNKERKINHIDDPINENMSLTELQKIAKERNITITFIVDGKKKIKNKKELCKEILENSKF